MDVISSSLGYFAFNAGIRLSYWDFNKEFLFSPRLNVAFVPERNPAWTLRFATGLYYQQPFYKEFRRPVADAYGNTEVLLNNEIKSQQSIHFILGTDRTFRMFSRPFKFSAEAYYKKLNNLIPYEIQNLRVVYQGENLTDGYTAGLDFKLFGQFVPGTDSWISFSFMKTSENLNGVNVPRPTDQRYSFALYFTDYFPKFPKLKFSLRGIFSDGLPTTFYPRQGVFPCSGLQTCRRRSELCFACSSVRRRQSIRASQMAEVNLGGIRCVQSSRYLQCIKLLLGDRCEPYSVCRSKLSDPPTV